MPREQRPAIPPETSARQLAMVLGAVAEMDQILDQGLWYRVRAPPDVTPLQALQGWRTLMDRLPRAALRGYAAACM